MAHSICDQREYVVEQPSGSTVERGPSSDGWSLKHQCPVTVLLASLAIGGSVMVGIGITVNFYAPSFMPVEALVLLVVGAVLVVMSFAALVVRSSARCRNKGEIRAPYHLSRVQSKPLVSISALKKLATTLSERDVARQLSAWASLAAVALHSHDSHTQRGDLLGGHDCAADGGAEEKRDGTLGGEAPLPQRPVRPAPVPVHPEDRGRAGDSSLPNHPGAAASGTDVGSDRVSWQLAAIPREQPQATHAASCALIRMACSRLEDEHPVGVSEAPENAHFEDLEGCSSNLALSFQQLFGAHSNSPPAVTVQTMPFDSTGGAARAEQVRKPENWPAQTALDTRAEIALLPEHAQLVAHFMVFAACRSVEARRTVLSARGDDALVVGNPFPMDAASLHPWIVLQIVSNSVSVDLIATSARKVRKTAEAIEISWADCELDSDAPYRAAASAMYVETGGAVTTSASMTTAGTFGHRSVIVTPERLVVKTREPASRHGAAACSPPTFASNSSTHSHPSHPAARSLAFRAALTAATRTGLHCTLRRNTGAVLGANSTLRLTLASVDWARIPQPGAQAPMAATAHQVLAVAQSAAIRPASPPVRSSSSTFTRLPASTDTSDLRTRRSCDTPQRSAGPQTMRALAKCRSDLASSSGHQDGRDVGHIPSSHATLESPMAQSPTLGSMAHASLGAGVVSSSPTRHHSDDPDRSRRSQSLGRAGSRSRAARAERRAGRTMRRNLSSVTTASVGSADCRFALSRALPAGSVVCVDDVSSMLAVSSQATARALTMPVSCVACLEDGGQLVTRVALALRAAGHALSPALEAAYELARKRQLHQGLQRDEWPRVSDTKEAVGSIRRTLGMPRSVLQTPGSEPSPRVAVATAGSAMAGARLSPGTGGQPEDATSDSDTSGAMDVTLRAGQDKDPCGTAEASGRAAASMPADSPTDTARFLPTLGTDGADFRPPTPLHTRCAAGGGDANVRLPPLSRQGAITRPIADPLASVGPGGVAPQAPSSNSVDALQSPAVMLRQPSSGLPLAPLGAASPPRRPEPKRGRDEAAAVGGNGWSVTCSVTTGADLTALHHEAGVSVQSRETSARSLGTHTPLHSHVGSSGSIGSPQTGGDVGQEPEPAMQLPRLIVSDLSMPVLDGVAAVTTVLDGWPPAVPPPVVLFLTGEDCDSPLLAAAEALVGRALIISKTSVSPTVLRQALLHAGLLRCVEDDSPLGARREGAALLAHDGGTATTAWPTASPSSEPPAGGVQLSLPGHNHRWLASNPRHPWSYSPSNVAERAPEASRAAAPSPRGPGMEGYTGTTAHQRQRWPGWFGPGRRVDGTRPGRRSPLAAHRRRPGSGTAVQPTSAVQSPFHATAIAATMLEELDDAQDMYGHAAQPAMAGAAVPHAADASPPAASEREHAEGAGEATSPAVPWRPQLGSSAYSAPGFGDAPGEMGGAMFGLAGSRMTGRQSSAAAGDSAAPPGLGSTTDVGGGHAGTGSALSRMERGGTAESAAAVSTHWLASNTEGIQSLPSFSSHSMAAQSRDPGSPVPHELPRCRGSGGDAGSETGPIVSSRGASSLGLGAAVAAGTGEAATHVSTREV